ncbi:MAG: hypothetical protein OXF46_02685 [Rhodobacteraceae bacterium]|nr:hypothetical protein [Paracoccaceae bacterium]
MRIIGLVMGVVLATTASTIVHSFDHRDPLESEFKKFLLVEIWECEGKGANAWNATLEGIHNPQGGRGLGTVQVENLPPVDTGFFIKGVKRVWAWVDKIESNVVYNIGILPDGSAYYLDGGMPANEDGLLKPSMYFTCSKQ